MRYVSSHFPHPAPLLRAALPPVRLIPLLLLLLLLAAPSFQGEALAWGTTAGVASAEKTNSGQTSEKTHWTLVKAFDGDSFILTQNKKQVEVRLLNVDCPEYRQEYWKKARAFTTAFLQRDDLRLEYSSEAKDRYGRTLAWVWSGDAMLNLELVRAGLALPSYVRQHPKYAEAFQQAQAEAKNARAGFWATGGLRMTPAQFRKKNRHK